MQTDVSRILLLHFLSTLITTTTTTTASGNGKLSSLSRRKRYIVFPEGSTLSVAICMTAQTILPTEVFTEAINWGIAYDLPNDTRTIREYVHPKHVMQRRHRRDLYQRMELIMDSMGYDGRNCIFKALCEASQRLFPNGDNVFEEILRIVFRFPQEKLTRNEPEEHRLYHWAYRIGYERKVDCNEMFNACSISLIDMALDAYGDG